MTPSAPDTANKCVCGRESPVCDSGWLADAHWKLCANYTNGHLCGHDIACHPQAPNATEGGNND